MTRETKDLLINQLQRLTGVLGKYKCSDRAFSEKVFSLIEKEIAKLTK
jgi:hypothetical protein